MQSEDSTFIKFHSRGTNYRVAAVKKKQIFSISRKTEGTLYEVREMPNGPFYS